MSYQPRVLIGEEKTRMLHLVNSDMPILMILGFLCSAFQKSQDSCEREIGDKIEVIVGEAFAKHKKESH